MYNSDRKLAKESIDVENSGQAVSVQMFGATVLSIAVRGPASAEYALDARLDGDDDWTQDVATTYSGDVDEVIRTGMPEVRVRCVTGTGTVDDTADVKLGAGGG